MMEPAKNQLCEIFGVVQFSTFATLSRVKRTSQLRARTSEFDPTRTWGAAMLPIPVRWGRRPIKLFTDLRWRALSKRARRKE
jgi:hypothetical protein